MTEYKINLSQKGIWQNELTTGHSAINTISVKLYIGVFSAECVKQAADRVISPANIFRVQINGNADGVRFAL